jgi:hypothetical protein
MTAAKIVTPAARPLNLYYALVQAGLAVTAAHADGKWRWDGHGLNVVTLPPSLPRWRRDAAADTAHDLVVAALQLLDAGPLLPGEVGSHA